MKHFMLFIYFIVALAVFYASEGCSSSGKLTSTSGNPEQNLTTGNSIDSLNSNTKIINNNSYYSKSKLDFSQPIPLKKVSHESRRVSPYPAAPTD